MGGSKRAKILITTTRRPSPRTRSLVKDLVSVIPGAIRFTRGHYNIEELSFEATAVGAARVIIVGTMRGNPSILRFYEPRPPKLYHIASLIVKGVALSREIGSGKLPSLRGLRLKVYPGSSEGTVPRVSELLMRGLMAGLAIEKRDGRAVVVSVDPRGSEAILTFWFRGAMVGPRLRVIPARRLELMVAKCEG